MRCRGEAMDILAALRGRAGASGQGRGSSSATTSLAPMARVADPEVAAAHTNRLVVTQKGTEVRPRPVKSSRRVNVGFVLKPWPGAGTPSTTNVVTPLAPATLEMLPPPD